MVSTCDEDIAMGAVGEVVAKIELCVICIIEQEQPPLLLPGKPIKSILF